MPVTILAVGSDSERRRLSLAEPIPWTNRVYMHNLSRIMVFMNKPSTKQNLSKNYSRCQCQVSFKPTDEHFEVF